MSNLLGNMLHPQYDVLDVDENFLNRLCLLEAYKRKSFVFNLGLVRQKDVHDLSIL